MMVTVMCAPYPTVIPLERIPRKAMGDYRSLLEAEEMLQTISGRANHYHNAWIETFMSTVKT